MVDDNGPPAPLILPAVVFAIPACLRLECINIIRVPGFLYLSRLRLFVLLC